MQIYFAGSIRGGRSDAEIYHTLVTYLKNFGRVLTEHVGDLGLTQKGDDGPDDLYIYDRDMQWLAVCDVVVAEVSQPSLGVGFELGRAVALEKPILCLYQPSSQHQLSAMINGCDKIETIAYSSIVAAIQTIEIFIEKIVKQSDIRKLI